MSDDESELNLSEQNEPVNRELVDSFAKELSRHGYGFQFSVIRKAHEMMNQGKSVWRFVASEFPVEVQGTGTRIDFILSRSRTAGGFDTSLVYLLAECKKANPKLSNWCFVRNRYTHDQTWGDVEYFIVECLEKDENAGLRVYSKQAFTTDKAYHLAVEVRSNLKGEPSGETGRAIENAATQISRGLNGYIQAIAANPQLLAGQPVVLFMPVIFTTARLFVSKVDISLADLLTGKCELTREQVESVPWLYYQYPLSPGLKHSVARKSEPKRVSDLLLSEYIRTIAVVSAEGIEDFLYNASYREFRG